MRGREFDQRVAELYKLEEKSVRVYTRLLKESGLLTTGARGVNAPHMTALDAARTTIALLATDKPSRAVEMVERFGALPFQPNWTVGQPMPPECWGTFDSSDTFESVLANIFNAPYVAGAAPYVEIQQNIKQASIEYGNGEGQDNTRHVLSFYDVGRSDEQVARDLKDLLGIRRACGVASSEITYLKFYLGRGLDRDEALAGDSA